MSVVDNDIRYFAAQNMPEDDTSPSGGGIDLTTRVVHADMSAPGVITIISDQAGDNAQFQLEVRDVTGAKQTEVLTLNGTTLVTGLQVSERVLKISYLSGTRTGNVTVAESGGSPVLVVIEPSVNRVQRFFYDVAAEVAGGAQRVYYEKFFVRNNNSTDALTSAQFQEVGAGTEEAKIDFDLESSLDGTDQVANRLTTPGGYTFDSTSKPIAGNDLLPNTAQGVWARLTLDPGDAANNGTWSTRLTGTTV